MPSALRRVSGALVTIGLVGGSLATAGAAVASQRHPAKATGDVRFVQFVKLANRHGDSTYINNPATNGKPRALVFVTSNWNPNNTPGGKYDDHPIGVWYNVVRRRWAIFNEDHAKMQLGRAFNVLVVPRASTTAFRVTASSSNIFGDSLVLNRPVTNGHSGLVLQVTQRWNLPGHVSGVDNNHNIGVRYSAPKWAIFEQDTGPMVTGASFNVLVGSSGTGGFLMVQKATSSNTKFNFTLIHNRRTNNNSRAMVFATPNWNPGGHGGTYDDSPIGVGYDKNVSPHLWSVFNQTITMNMPVHAAFNLLIFRTR